MASDNGVYKLVHLADESKAVEGQDIPTGEVVPLVTISSVRDQARVFESFCKSNCVVKTLFIFLIPSLSLAPCRFPRGVERRWQLGSRLPE